MPAPPEKKEGIPAWIVSFCDMVTLLLAFFVLLQAFAHEQNPDLFYEGQGSFQRAIKGLGLPMWLDGKRPSPGRDWYVKRYTTETDPDNPGENMVDAKEEELQKLFQKVKEQLDSDAKDLPRPVRVETLAQRFGDGSSELTDDLRGALDSLVEDLSGLQNDARRDVYIIGLAPGEKGQTGWVLSARRAWAAERYVRQRTQNVSFNWKMHAWGGGSSFGTFPDDVDLGWVIMGDRDDG